MFLTTKELLTTAFRITKLAKHEIEKEVNKLLRSGAIQRNDARTILNICLKEAKQEQQRTQKFFLGELKRQLGKTKTLTNILADRGQKALKAHGIIVKTAQQKKKTIKRR